MIKATISRKFNIGDEVYFMKDNKPVQGTIDGIAMCTGKHRSGYCLHPEVVTDEYTVYYSMEGNSYDLIKENELFNSTADLKLKLFADLI
jgi:hypothetical protein